MPDPSLNSRFLRWWARQPAVPLGRKSAFRKLCRANRGRTFQVETRDAFKMEITAGDPVANLIFGYGEFEPGLSRLFRQLAPGASSLVDVGCNIGYFSCLFRRHAAAAARLLAVDANPAMAHACEKNLRLNGFEGRVLHRAVSDRTETVTLHCPRSKPSYATAGASEETDAETIEVQAQPLSALLTEAGLEKIGILKIDIEGYEVRLFRGLDTATIGGIDHLIFEFSPGNLRRCGHDPAEIWSFPWWERFELSYVADRGVVPFQRGGALPEGAEIIWAKRRYLKETQQQNRAVPRFLTRV